MPIRCLDKLHRLQIIHPIGNDGEKYVAVMVLPIARARQGVGA